MKKAVITGCTGAIGTALIEELIQEDWKITAVSRKGTKRISAIPEHEKIKIVECNLEEYDTLSNQIEEQQDVFFHFAWAGTYGESRNDVLEQNKNVEYTLMAVKCATELGCKVFIGAGSQSEFGHVEGILRPNLCCTPETAYGAAKLSACNLSRILCNQLGIRHNWCRILSVYGPYDGEYTMVMSIIRDLLDGKKPSCTKGDQIWDYIYNKDVARAFRLVAEKGKENEIYCFGTGETRTLHDYISCIRDIINPDMEVRFGDRDYYPNQVMHLEADITNLKEDTGFSVKYSFEEGIKETIDWVKSKRETTL